jgi:hypothetical protein
VPGNAHVRVRAACVLVRLTTEKFLAPSALRLTTEKILGAERAEAAATLIRESGGVVFHLGLIDRPFGPVLPDDPPAHRAAI